MRHAVRAGERGGCYAGGGVFGIAGIDGELPGDQVGRVTVGVGREDICSFGAALAAAVDAAGDLGVDLAGGASTVQRALRADAIDDLILDIIPITLGNGERLLDNVPGLSFEPVEVAHSPYATHIRYRHAQRG